MSGPSSAQRVRSRFVSFSLWTSALAFLVVEGNALLDQLDIGHAGLLFMLGTACLSAGVCIGLFAFLMLIGLAISLAFSEESASLQTPGGKPAETVPRATQPLRASGPLEQMETPIAALPLQRTQMPDHEHRLANTTPPSVRSAVEA